MHNIKYHFIEYLEMAFSIMYTSVSVAFLWRWMQLKKKVLFGSEVKYQQVALMY